jgi:hypothetical protein
MNLTTRATHITEIELPAAEALLAGTLALMTGFDDPQAESPLRADSTRALVARKISENLSLLATHPMLTPAFQTVVWGLCNRWRGICAKLCGGTVGTPWAMGAETVQ